MNTKLELVKIAMQDSEFVARISALEDPEEVQKAFAEKGIEFSLEEINDIAEQIVGMQNEELTESQMETVTGGVDPFTVAGVIVGTISLAASVITEINKSRKEKGKKTIW